MKVAVLIEIDPGDGAEENEFDNIEEAFLLPDMESAVAEGVSIATGYLIDESDVSIIDVRRADRYRSLRGLP